MKMISYRNATYLDLPAIRTFTDFWLSGRGMRKNEPGACNDCFISSGQHKGYIRLSTVLLAFDDTELVAWAVKHHNETLIHMLVAAPYRLRGIGAEMVSILNPSLVRSKTDQSTGNPTPFYEKLGFVKVGVSTSKPSFRKPHARKAPIRNIDVLARKPS